MALTLLQSALLRRQTPGRSNPVTPFRPVPTPPRSTPPPSPVQQVRRIPKVRPGAR